MSDPLSGYSQDWRKKKPSSPSLTPATDTTDPLAGYKPEWRKTAAVDHDEDAEHVAPQNDISMAARQAGQDAFHSAPVSIFKKDQVETITPEVGNPLGSRVKLAPKKRQPMKVPAAPRDATDLRDHETPLDAIVRSVKELNPTEPPPPTTFPGKVADAVGRMAAHPVETAVGFATALPQAGFKLGQYARQEIAKGDAARRGEVQDGPGIVTPGKDVVSGKEAAASAAQLAAVGAAGPAESALERALLRRGLGEHAAVIAAKGATGAGVGATFTPDDPGVGAVIGGVLGGLQSKKVVKRLPEQQLAPDINADRVKPVELKPARQGKATVEEPVKATEPDFEVADNFAPLMERVRKEVAKQNEAKAAETARATEAIKGLTTEDGRPLSSLSPEELKAAVEGRLAAMRNAPEPVAEKPVIPATEPEPLQKPAVEEAPKKHDYSSTQVQLPQETGNALKQFSAKIPDTELAEDGREDDPHITVKFGLHGNEPQKVAELLRDEPPIRVRLGSTSLFSNKDADVLKVDVISRDLHRINKKIADALPHTDTHPTYIPHATIAYLKPGEGKKYSGDKSFAGQKITISSIVFSGQDGQKIEIPLGGKPKGPSLVEQAREAVADAKPAAEPLTVRTKGGSVRDLAKIHTNELLTELVDLYGKNNEDGNLVYPTTSAEANSSHYSGDLVHHSSMKDGAIHASGRIASRKITIGKIEKELEGRGVTKDVIADRLTGASEEDIERMAMEDGGADTDLDYFNFGANKPAPKKAAAANEAAKKGSILEQVKAELKAQREAERPANPDFNERGEYDPMARPRKPIDQATVEELAEGYREHNVRSLEQIRRTMKEHPNQTGVDRAIEVLDRVLAEKKKAAEQQEVRPEVRAAREDELEPDFVESWDDLSADEIRAEYSKMGLLEMEELRRRDEEVTKGGGRLLNGRRSAVLDELIKNARAGREKANNSQDGLFDRPTGNRTANNLSAESEPARFIPPDVDLEEAANIPDKTPFDTPMVKAARLYNESRQETYTVETPERVQRRAEMVQDEYNRITQDAEEDFGELGRTKEIGLVIGLPGSGKSRNAIEPLAKHLKAAVASVDDFKVHQIPEYAEGWGNEIVYKEAGPLTKQVRARLRDGGFNYIHEGVGAPPDGYVKLVNDLAAEGYKVHLVRVQVSPDEAKRRMVQRFEAGGHFIRPEYVDYVGTQDAQAYEAVKNHPAVASFALIDHDKLGKPVVVEERGADWLEGVVRRGGAGRAGSGGGAGGSHDRPAEVRADEPGSGLRDGVEAADPLKDYSPDWKQSGDSVSAPKFSIDDIPLRVATDAYQWSSMTPEKRADQWRAGYVKHLQEVYDEFKALAQTPEQEAIFETEFQRYQQGYLKRDLQLLGAMSRTASAMVTGPANFPTERNRKANERVAKLNSEALEWSKRAQNAMRNAIAPGSSGIISSDDPDAIEALQAKVDRLTDAQEKMKAFNRLVLHPLTKGVLPEQLREAAERLVKELEELDLRPPSVKDLVEGDFAKRKGFPDYKLRNNLAKIKGAKARVADLTKRRGKTTAEQSFDGVRMVENVEANRLQLFFDGKPAPEMIKTLKSNGFKWAPSVGAWQRQLTDNARRAAKEILGNDDRVSEALAEYRSDWKSTTTSNTKDSPEFSHWFGDSKVVDETGKPLVMYHGTPVWERDGKTLGHFEVFDRKHSQKALNREPVMDHVGSWFTDVKGAHVYAGESGTIYPVYLSIKNPKVLTWDEFFSLGQKASGWKPTKRYKVNGATFTQRNAPGKWDPDPLRDQLIARGYDGLKFPASERTDGNPADVWVAFEPTQIKSAIGNSGAFDPENPSILFESQPHYGPVPERSPKQEKADQLEDAKIAFGSLANRAKMAAQVEQILNPGERARQVDAGQRVWGKDRAHGTVSLMGQKLETPEKLAQAMSVFRHPGMEVQHFVMVDKGFKVLGHFAWTAGALNWARIPKDLQAVIERAKELGAVSVIPVHNHPSGDPTPSNDDLRMTLRMGRLLLDAGLGMPGHLIINHGKATWIGPDGSANPFDVSGMVEKPWATALEQGQIKVTSPEALASVVIDSMDPEALTLVYLDASLRAVAVWPKPIEAIDSFNEWATQELKALGARSVFVVAPKSEAEWFARNGVPDIVLDVYSVEPSRNGPPRISSLSAGLSPVRRGFSPSLRPPGFDEPRPIVSNPATRRRYGSMEDGGRSSGISDDRVSEDLFGNKDESDFPQQESLFGEKEGTAAARNLSQSEESARAEIEQLEQEKGYLQPLVERGDKRAAPGKREERLRKINARLADLRRLVNRNESIGADELRNRAAGEDQGMLFEREPEYSIPQTETAAFKRWFEGSAVVDESGNPLRVYHGTRDSFDTFDPSRQGSLGERTVRGGAAFFFTDDPAIASDYATGDRTIDQFHPLDRPNVMPVYLALQNPLEIDAEGRTYSDVTDQAIRQARRAGHDGVIVRNVIDHASAKRSTEEGFPPITVYVAFHPEQIKSATGNSGEFDPDNNSIVREDSPEYEPFGNAEEDEPLVGIKNSESEKTRLRMGMEERERPEPRTQEEMYEAGKNAARRDPLAVTKLLNDLRNDPERIVGTETEAGLMLMHRVNLDRRLHKLVDRQSTTKDPSEKAKLAQELATVRAEIKEFIELAERTGTATGRALAARKMMSKLDYSLATMEAMAEAAKGSPLTELELARVKALYDELHKRMDAVEKDLIDARKRAAEAEAEREHAQMLLDALGTAPKPVITALDKAAEAARARLRARGFKASAGMDPADLADHAIIGAAEIARGARRFGDWSGSMIKIFGDAIKPHLEEIFEASTDRLTDALKKQKPEKEKPSKPKKGTGTRKVGGGGRRTAGEPIDPEEIITLIAERYEAGDIESLADIRMYLRELALGYIRDGITGREALLDQIVIDVQEAIPDAQREEVRDALSGYGMFRPLDRAAEKVKLRELTAEMQKLAQLEAIERKEAPLATGFERQEPSPEVRRLTKIVNDAKRKLGIFNEQDAASRLKSALSAAKTRTRNAIVDLQAEIDTGVRTIQGKRTPISDPELEILRAQLSDLRKIEEQVFGKRELTDEQRLQLATAGAKRSAAGWAARLEDAKSGKFNTGPAKRPMSSAEIEAYRAQAKAAKEEYLELQALDPESQKTATEKANQMLRARLARQEAELLDRMARQDFAPRKKKELSLDAESINRRAKVAQIKRQYAEALRQFERENRSLGQKALDAVKAVPGTAKSLKASLDMSALLRQGLRPLLTHPGSWLKASAASFEQAFKALGENDASSMDKFTVMLWARPNAELYRRAKLALTEAEEAYPSSLPEKIPGLGRLFRASQAAFTAFQYQIRAEVFDTLLEIAKKSGVDIEDTEQLRSIGRLVNSLTGRAHLGRAEPAADIVNVLFFAPRNVKAHFDVLTGHMFDREMSGFGRKRAGINLIKIISALAAILVIIKMLWPDSVEEDPRSADFGQVRVGNTRFNLSGGMASLVILASRLATRESKSSTTGVTKALGTGNFGAPTGTDLVYNFFENKLSPAASVAKDLLEGRDFQGNKVTLKGELVNAFAPLPITNYQELKNDPKSAPLVAALIADAVGIGTNTYGAGKSRNPTPADFRKLSLEDAEATFAAASPDQQKRWQRLLEVKRVRAKRNEKKRVGSDNP